jgi:hypothetical protein
MKHIKLYEEFKGSRIKPTSEEKQKLREITRTIIKHFGKGLSNDIDEKYTILFDLGELKNLIRKDNYLYGSEFIKNNPNRLESDDNLHKKDNYKRVDDFAKKLSEERRVQIIFDRKNGCFITESGKGLATVDVRSEYSEYLRKMGIDDNVSGVHVPLNQVVYINYKTGDIFNEKARKNDEKIKNKDYVRVWDFTGDNISMSINREIRVSKMVKSELPGDIFSTLYHEFIHVKDPLAWSGSIGGSEYLGNKEVYDDGSNGGVYYSHDTEVQTLSNQFLELVEYYFERTLRGDTDGRGVNYNLTKEDINGRFIPNIMEIVDFINGKINKLSMRVQKELTGTSKNFTGVYSLMLNIVNMKKEDPEDGKVIIQWMRDDFNHLVDYYNTRVIEINKRKEKGQELPLLHKGFPFEVSPVKPTPANVIEVTDAIEPTKPANRPGISAATPPVKPVKPANSPSIDSSKFKFVSNATSKNLPSEFNLNEFLILIERYSRILGLAYSKCYIDRYKSPETTVEVDTALKTLLREVKTRDIKRIKEAIETFFDMISPKISDNNVKNWLNTSDGRKWGEAISKFEKMCSLA